jgi:hypothetical protein
VGINSAINEPAPVIAQMLAKSQPIGYSTKPKLKSARVKEQPLKLPKPAE